MTQLLSSAFLFAFGLWAPATVTAASLHGAALIDASASLQRTFGSAVDMIHGSGSTKRSQRRVSIENKGGGDAEGVFRPNLLGTRNQLQTCQVNLEQCQAKLDAPTFLFVQMANSCSLSRTDDGNYTLSTLEMAEETWAFSDRPFQVVETMSTDEFFTNFTGIFSEETGGRPNAAFTFVHEDSQEFNGPMVAVMVEALYTTVDETAGTKIHSYQLTQSPSQAATISLDEFFVDVAVPKLGIDGLSLISENFADCSIFIDTVDLNEVDFGSLNGKFTCFGACSPQPPIYVYP